MNRILLFICCISAFYACTRVQTEYIGEERGDVETVYSACPELRCLPFDETEGKSSIPDGLGGKISDVNVFVYRDGKLVPQAAAFSSGESGRITVEFPDEKGPYNVYCLANVGRVFPCQEESDIRFFSVNAGGVSSLSDKGFPMAATYLSVKPSDFSRICFTRLFGVYRLSFSDSSSKTEYRIKSVGLKNCSIDLYPFLPGAASRVSTGDYLSDEDLEILNGGGSVDLYVPENLQGSLLPGNTDPKQRVPSNLGSASSLCTYIEVSADVQTPTAHYPNAVYRAYLGSNLNDDFSIGRNMAYPLHLDFEADMLRDEDWRKAPGPYDITGAIELSSSLIPVFASMPSSVSCLDISVPEGAEYTVSVPSSVGKTALTYSCDAPSRMDPQAGTVFCGNGKFVFSSSLKMANTPYGSDALSQDIPVVIATTDGILSETVTVRLYKSGFPVKFKYADGYMWIRAVNPLYVRMKIDMTLTCAKSDGSFSRSSSDSATLVPGNAWTRISSMPSSVLSSSASGLPDKCTFAVDLSFPDGEQVDILNPSGSSLPFYISNVPDMIPAKGPAYVTSIGNYTVKRGFDGAILSCPASVFAPSDRTWHDAFVAKELENVSDPSLFMVADQSFITKWNDSRNTTYLKSTNKYVVITSSGMDLGLSYTYNGNWYDFRNVMRLSSENHEQFPVLAHFGHSLSYERYEEANRTLCFLVNSQSWWYAFGLNSDWFSAL